MNDRHIKRQVEANKRYQEAQKARGYRSGTIWMHEMSWAVIDKLAEPGESRGDVVERLLRGDK